MTKEQKLSGELSLSEILDRHVDALGGKEALEATALTEAAIVIEGVSPQELRLVHDEATGRLRAEVSVASLGLEILKGFDGRLAWEKGPVYDGWYAADHPETLRAARELKPLWQLAGNPEETNQAKLLGTAPDRDGRRCYVIERIMTNEADQEIPVRNLIDSETFLLQESRSGDDDVEVQIYSDYRSIEGRLMPFETLVKTPMGDIVQRIRSVASTRPNEEVFRHPDKEPVLSSTDDSPDEAALRTIWQTVKDVHFDKTFGGVDWDAVLTDYLPRVRGVEAPGGMGFVKTATQMVNELLVTHYSVLPREQTQSGERRARQPGRIGLGLRLIDDAVAVYELDPGSPAEAGPLRPGFLVIAVNGKDEAELKVRHADAVSHDNNPLRARVMPFTLELRAAAGEEVEISYLNDKEETNVTILTASPREPQEDPRFLAELPDEILHVSFRFFFGDVAADFREALRSHPKARGILLDLRGNPGGSAQIPVEIAAALHRDGASMGEFIYRNQANRLRGEPFPDAYLGPVAILVDAFSASCSELLAGALQETGRARVFGRRTAGAVLPSTRLLLPNGCAFQFVVCDYKTEGGTRLEGRGVLPDDGEIRFTRQDLLEGRDPDREAALRWIGTVAPPS